MDRYIIAIDGHAGCGKSSTAKQVAKRLGYMYIDTGAMYRAVTLYFLQNKVDTTNPHAVAKALENIEIRLKLDPMTGSQRVMLNSKDVEDKIRDLEVSQAVSSISTISAVRKKMVAQQQEMGAVKGVVMDGRDIGTVVFPNADLKIFMTASDEVRAQRRLVEMQQKGEVAEFETILANLRERDKIDSTRADSPLKKADDAYVIDTSNITFEQQVNEILKIVEDKLS